MAKNIHTETDAMRSDEHGLAAWTTPRVKRLHAGDAEDGYDPIVPDAGITKS